MNKATPEGRQGMARQHGQDKQRPHDHAHRNTLTVGLFGGAMGGFIIAMMLGAFRATGTDSLTDWIVAVTAVGAALVSGLAVVLVALTLKATRDTLDATQRMAEDQRQMAADQKRIGEAQTRPWLLVEKKDIIDKGEMFEYRITLKNYGTTPATGINARMKIMGYDWDEDQNGQPFRTPCAERNMRTAYIHAIPPNGEYTIIRMENCDVVEFGFDVEIQTEVAYHMHDGNRRLDLSDYAMISTGDNGIVVLYQVST